MILTRGALSEGLEFIAILVQPDASPTFYGVFQRAATCARCFQ